MNSKKRILVPVKYLGGHPELPKEDFFILGEENDKLIFYQNKSFFSLKPKEVFSIPKADILGVNLQRSSQRSAGKAAAGAIVGGVLTGGVGAIIGAAIGGRKRDDSIIIMTVKYEDIELELLFDGLTEKDDVRKKYAELVALLKH